MSHWVKINLIALGEKLKGKGETVFFLISILKSRQNSQCDSPRMVMVKIDHIFYLTCVFFKKAFPLPIWNKMLSCC